MARSRATVAPQNCAAELRGRIARLHLELHHLLRLVHAARRDLRLERDLGAAVELLLRLERLLELGDLLLALGLRRRQLGRRLLRLALRDRDAREHLGVHLGARAVGGRRGARVARRRARVERRHRHAHRAPPPAALGAQRVERRLLGEEFVHHAALLLLLLALAHLELHGLELRLQLARAARPVLERVDPREQRALLLARPPQRVVQLGLLPAALRHLLAPHLGHHLPLQLVHQRVDGAALPRLPPLVGQLVLVRVQLVLPHRQPPDLLVLVDRHQDRPPPRARLEADRRRRARARARRLVEGGVERRHRGGPGAITAATVPAASLTALPSATSLRARELDPISSSR